MRHVICLGLPVVGGTVLLATYASRKLLTALPFAGVASTIKVAIASFGRCKVMADTLDILFGGDEDRRIMYIPDELILGGGYDNHPYYCAGYGEAVGKGSNKNNQLREKINKLEGRLGEIEDRLGQNSKNSSRPPSKDEPWKKKETKGKETGSRKRGGQKAPG